MGLIWDRSLEKKIGELIIVVSLLFSISLAQTGKTSDAEITVRKPGIALSPCALLHLRAHVMPDEHLLYARHRDLPLPFLFRESAVRNLALSVTIHRMKSLSKGMWRLRVRAESYLICSASHTGGRVVGTPDGFQDLFTCSLRHIRASGSKWLSQPSKQN
ncbi:MAG: hypothetical protein J2P21_25445 [Chloracidobacterium sp.]|nr:hypothetical protein [Chloracidobacterium sp.]